MQRRSCLTWGAVLWTALILGLYYWVHKPLNGPLVSAWGGAILDLMLASLVVIVGAGIGRRILRWVDVSAWSLPERIAAPALIGLGLLSLLILLVGSIWLHAVSMIALLVIVVVLFRRETNDWLFDLLRLRREKIPADGWERFIAISLLIVLALTLVLSTLPPTKWDVLTYHIVGPQAYVQRGHFYAAPDNHFLGFPQGVETLYAGLMALSGRVTAGGPLHWLIGALMLLMVGGYTARHAGRIVGWIAVIVLLAGTTIWHEMTFAYVDLMLLGLAVVALAVIERWEICTYHTTTEAIPPTEYDPPASEKVKRNNNHTLVLLGLILGLALGVKYTAFWLGLAFGLRVLWCSRKDGLTTILRRGALIAGIALIVFLPWLMRNTIWYHNPVYPFAFESADMDSIRQDWYRQPDSGMVFSSVWWQWPVMPVMATILGLENGYIYGADIGPLYLILLPLLGLVWGRLPDDRRAVLRRILWISLILYLGWWLSAGFGSYINIQARLVLYLFPLLAITAAITLDGLRLLPDKPINLGFVMRAMVGLVIVFLLIDVTRFTLNSGIQAYFSGEDSYREDYLRDTLGVYYDAVSELPEDSDVWFLWEPRSLYCDQAHCRPDSLMDVWYYARRTGTDPAWREADYLLVYEKGRTIEEDEQDLYHDSDWIAWETFVAQNLDVVRTYRDSDDEVIYILYRWK